MEQVVVFPLKATAVKNNKKIQKFVRLLFLIKLCLIILRVSTKAENHFREKVLINQGLIGVVSH